MPGMSSKSKKTSLRPVEAEDLLKMHFPGDPQFSPDGSRILFAKRNIHENKYVSQLFLADAAGGDSVQITQGEGGAGHGRWSPDGSRIAFISGRNKPSSQIFVLPVAGGEAAKLTSFPEGSLGWFLWSPDGRHILASFREPEPSRTEEARKKREEKNLSTPPWEVDNLWYRLDGDGYFGSARYKLYLVDAASGEHHLLYDKDPMGSCSACWLPDSSGLVVCHSTKKQPWLEQPDDQLFRLDLKGKAKRIATGMGGSKNTLRVSPDGSQIAFFGDPDPAGWGVNNTRLFAAPLAGGDARCLTSSDDFDMEVLTLSDTNPGFVSDGGGSGFLEWTPDGSRILVNIGWHGGVQLAAVDPEKGGCSFITEGRHCFVAGSLSPDGKTVAGGWGSDTRLIEIALADATNGSLKTVTGFNDGLLKQLDLAHAEEMWVDSTDDTKVHAWVMLPPGRKAKKLPAVLEIHGGPHAQYGWAFFHEFQLLCAQGYVVVFSNPRGSKGYGEEFCKAIKGDWGNKDWDDIKAVRDAMKAHPAIDPSRMGVMGGSYGGYMTNWVIGHTRDFAGAITDRCVSNWVSMAGNSDWPMNRDQYFGGYAWGGIPAIESLWRQSPLAYFDRVKTPTLVIHSEGDLRCNVEQGEQVFHALQAQGVPSRFVRYPSSTSHGLSRNGPPDLRLHRLGEIVAWWKKWLG